MSIPVISSQMILGALTGGAGLIASGMSQTAQTVAGGSQVAQQQTAVGELRFRYHDERRARMDANVDMLFGRLPSTPQQRDRYRAGNPEYRQDTLAHGAHAADHIAGLPAGDRQGFRDRLRNGTAQVPGPNGRAIQARPGGAAYPIATQNRAFLDTSRLNQTMRTLEGMAQNVGALRMQHSALAEVGSPTSTFAWQAGNPVYQRVQAAFRSFSGGNNYQMTLIENQMRESGVTGDALLAWTQFNINYSADNQGHAGRARVWGMLEVPWTMASGAVADDAYDQQMRTDHVNRQSATITAMAEIMRDFQAQGVTPQGGLLITNQGVRDHFANYFRGQHQLTAEQVQDIQRFLENPVLMGTIFPSAAPAPADRGAGRLPSATLQFFMRPQGEGNR